MFALNHHVSHTARAAARSPCTILVKMSRFCPLVQLSCMPGENLVKMSRFCPLVQLRCMAWRKLGVIIPILSPWYKNSPRFVPNSLAAARPGPLAPPQAPYMRICLRNFVPILPPCPASSWVVGLPPALRGISGGASPSSLYIYWRVQSSSGVY